MISSDSNLSWHGFERELLPIALFGRAAIGAEAQSLGAAIRSGQGIALGFEVSRSSQAFASPEFIVVDDRSSREVFSWLRTFAPETWPLSQFGKVFLRSDWETLCIENEASWSRSVSTERWACVILGELLAQREKELSIEAVSYSWSASCFSTAVAQASTRYQSSNARFACIDRLRSLEVDHRFIRRPLKVHDLLSIWDFTASGQARDLEIALAAQQILSIGAKGLDSSIAAVKPLDAIMGPSSDLLSDSFEARVIAFQQLISDLDASSQIGSYADVVVAVAAFLVGRGTSHVFLLTRVAKRWPRALVWYSLLAALIGPKCWDVEWSRAAKGVERLIRVSRLSGNGVFADLSWAEYASMPASESGPEAFSNLPRLVPKVLSIEVIPGAFAQLRTLDSMSPNQNTAPQESMFQAIQRRKLGEALSEIATLVEAAKLLLDHVPPPNPSTKQESFEFQGPALNRQQTERPRRRKR